MSAFHGAAPLACAGLRPIAGTALHAQRRLLAASAKWCPGGYRLSGYAAPSANLSYSSGLCVVVLRSERGENRNEAVDDPGAFAGDVAGACTGRWAKSSIVVWPDVLQARSMLWPHRLRAFVEQQKHQGQRRRGYWIWHADQWYAVDPNAIVDMDSPDGKIHYCFQNGEIICVVRPASM